MIHLSSTEPIARKHHSCMACELLLEGESDPDKVVWYYDLPEKWAKAWMKAKENNFKIIPGQKYMRWTNVDSGNFYTGKAIPEIYEIANELELFNDK